MSTPRLVLIHGWQDDAASFEHLARHLGGALGRETRTIDLADWVSLDDDVTYDDLAAALNDAWNDKDDPLPRSGRGVDVVVHSTGALVVRAWLLKYGGDVSSPPIKRLLQLAPANFGSPLAHHGRSFAGRAIIGFKNLRGDRRTLRRTFEPGERLLRGLELGAPFTRDLAMRDRFGPDAQRFGPGGILSTVLIGNEGTVLLADFDGSDGVVRTSNANMNCAHAEVEFLKQPESLGNRRIDLDVVESAGPCAFRVINGFDHGGIKLDREKIDTKTRFGTSNRQPGGMLDDIGVRQSDLLALMTRALTIEDDGFEAWCRENDRATAKLTAALDKVSDDEVHGHMSVAVRVRNQYGQPVEDFVLELFDAEEFDDDTGAHKGHRSGSVTRKIQREAIDDVHTYGPDTSCRCFHIDCAAFFDGIASELHKGLWISVTARPVLTEGVETANTVGYYSLRDEDIGSVFIPRGQLRDVFVPHRTLLLDITMTRAHTDRLLEIRPATGEPE